jgi:hypothetical protein
VLCFFAAVAALVDEFKQMRIGLLAGHFASTVGLADHGPRYGQREATPTDSTWGERHYTRLCLAKHWNRVCGDGPAFLTLEQQTEMDAMQFPNKETGVILHLTSQLERLVTQASTVRGVPAVLVNSERHYWMKCCHGGTDTAPDGLVAHPASVALEAGTGDLKFCVRHSSTPSECGAFPLPVCVSRAF